MPGLFDKQVKIMLKGFLVTGSFLMISSIIFSQQLLFNSGFEEGTRLEQISNGHADGDIEIIGKDLSVNEPNDWVADIDENPLLGDIELQYQGGDSTMRYAKIINEPGKESNRVLQFWTHYPNVKGRKTRIQANLFERKGQDMPGIYELYQSVRIFLPEEMNLLKDYPDRINWLTIFEVWNNIQWKDDPYPFRITIGIGKETLGHGSLHFIMGAEDYEYGNAGKERGYHDIWYQMNKKIEVPVGEWFTLEYYVKEGDKETGRFFMLMQKEGEEKKVICDIRDFTCNTRDPNPDGITLWNPIKLYTSKKLVDYMRENNSALEILWDDLEIWKDKIPEID